MKLVWRVLKVTTFFSSNRFDWNFDWKICSTKTNFLKISHSDSKFRVSATEAFRKATFTEVSSSKILPETSGFWTETSGFLNRNFGFFEPKLRVFETKLRDFSSYQKFEYWLRDFLRPKLRNIKSIRSFGWAETGEILEISGENKIRCTIFCIFFFSTFFVQVHPVD
jgi:hypothetical protein